MKRIFKIILFVLVMVLFLKWLDNKDYFRYNYLELSEEEQEIFKWKSHYDAYLDHRKVYEKYFGDERYMFPRQKVSKIKLLEKDKVFNTFWISSRLKSERIDQLVALFNNPENFDWGETTWSDEDTDYIFKFYDSTNRLIGKIDLCNHGCSMVKSKPFSPNMKYGKLSAEGQELLYKIIYKLDYWE